MTYDAENRMTSTNAGVGYTYDGDGKRVAKSNGKLYWYGMSADALLETDATGGTINEYVFFGGKRIARRNSSGTVFYYVADHLGTSRAMLTVGSLSPCYEADYYPFGGERVVTNTCPQDYKFTGKERDTETGLDYFVARYYSSQYGRFASADPENAGATLDDPSSWNAYTYVTNNPLRYVDPFGLARVNERGEWEGESHGEKDCSTNNGCLYWNDDANEWQHEPPPSRDPRSSMLDGVASDPQMTTLYSVNDNYISPAFLNMMSLLPVGPGARAISLSLSRSVVREGGKGAGKILGRGSTGRTVARNLREQLAMEQAMSNPAGGKQLTNVVMRDKRWPAAEGWVKMEQNVNGVKIHYVRNTITGAVDDFKFVVP